MKTYILLAATCVILAGCASPEANNREVLSQIASLRSDLASRSGQPVRWAYANKREIETIIFQASSEKMEQTKRAETLTPEQEEKVRLYDALLSELTRKRMDAIRARTPMSSGMPATDPETEALMKKVSEAKAPISDIIERRNQQATAYREQYTVEKLVAEYVKDRFDLVVDSSDASFSRTPVLYRASGEVLDITDGVIKLFRDKNK